MHILNKKYRNTSYLQILAHNMRRNHPIKYIVLDDFLDPEFFDSLMNEIHTSKHHLVWDSNWREIHYTSWYFSKIFWSFYLSQDMRDFLYNFYPKWIKIEWLKWWKNILQKFLNIFSRKNGLFFRKNVIFSQLDWHTDWPQSKIAWSFILYLNKEWESAWGWNLVLWYPSVLWIHPYAEIPPICNRCVLLVCEENISWHRVSRLTWPNSRLFIHDQILYI